MNEEYGKDEQGREIMGEIICFCCGYPVLVRKSKTAKPFFTCSCGTHVFFRQKKSIACINDILKQKTVANDESMPIKDGEIAKKKKWFEV